MASAESVRVGNLVPISLLISDGNENMFPQALVKDEDSILLIVINLEHKGNGLYAPADIDKYYMPDQKSISVSFIVYKDALHTVISDYQYDLDIYEKELISLQIGDDLNIEIDIEDIEVDIEVEQELKISVEAK